MQRNFDKDENTIEKKRKKKKIKVIQPNIDELYKHFNLIQEDHSQYSLVYNLNKH